MTRPRVKNHSWLYAERALPLAIAHRGASHYAYDNSAAAFESAVKLDADFWEIDVRTTRDGVLVAYHDADLNLITGQATTIAELGYQELRALTERHHKPVERLTTLLELASKSSVGIYLDAKDLTAVQEGPALLKQYGVERAVIACFDSNALRQLADTGCHYPLSVLVPPGKDPFLLAEQTSADIIHLCWEHAGSRPQDLVTPELIEEAQRRKLAIVLWHEERIEIVTDLLKLPVLGICSNQPELLKPYTTEFNDPPEIACHRGANSICPENTVAAAHCAFSAGYQYVELDVQATIDHQLLVIHDDRLDRTTTGTGLVREQTLKDIENLDAGSWFNPFFHNTKVPSLTDMLKLTVHYNGGLYIEIKTASVVDILNLVTEFSMLENCFFWSFNQSYLSAIREQFPSANIMTRRKDYKTLEESIHFVNAQIIEFDFLNDDLTELEGCRRAGSKTMIAYNGTDKSSFHKILDAGPDIINLNHPNLLRQCMRQRLR